MRYEMLGSLHVVDDAMGESVAMGRKAETLLAVLLVRAGQVVSTDELISELWNGAAPRRATAALHVYVSQIRKGLPRKENGDSPVVTRQGGYLLRTERGEVDADEFLALVDRARTSYREGRHEGVVDACAKALELWRGPALGELIEGPVLFAHAAWLEETRLECLELMMEASLALGRHRQVVGHLQSLVVKYPLRETFYQLLMTALYRCDRQAEALQVYRLASRHLNEEIGIEPCRALKELHEAILVGDRLAFSAA
ncbi:AfsR/SARP family transcriptional regulator [Streptomyces sp. NPDC052051]|uniref:AfsR/SARP family transcriptional regulator n=1 Tax=Streptomyces sp. NPDC052051 TaxID=3154649 RepID=UPI00343EF053